MVPGSSCLIAMNHHWDRPTATSHDDVYALVEIVKLADEIKCPTDIVPANQVHAVNSDRT